MLAARATSVAIRSTAFCGSSAILAVLALASAAPAAAQGDRALSDEKNRVVLELFTSQGCSSCPPADALLGSYAARRDVIALTMAVDYWDYLGWKDTLASPTFSARQRAYAKRRGDGMVYTPQIVVHGRHHVNGARAGDIDAAIAAVRAGAGRQRIDLHARADRDGLVIEVGGRQQTGADTAASSGSGAGKSAKDVVVSDGTLWLALVERKVEVPIRNSENRGRKIAYYNVVRSLRSVGTWKGAQTTVRLERASLTGAEAVVVMLQAEKGGPLLAATELRSLRTPDPAVADEKR